MGNKEQLKAQCVFVDNTPPIGTKEVGDPKVPLCDFREPEEYIEEFVLDDNPNAMTVSVTKTLDCEKVIWDIELEEQDCEYGHSEFGLIISDASDHPVFHISTGQMHGAGSPPVIKEWNGGWSGTMPLYDGIVVTNPGGTDGVGYGDRKFHIEIPMEYLNSGSFYWAVTAYGGSCMNGKNGFQQYPIDWDKWMGHGRYAYGGFKDFWVMDHVTPITLDCEDQEPHPVDQETVCYRVSFDLDTDGYVTDEYCSEFGGTMIDGWCCAYVGDGLYVFDFMEDSLHDLEYYCEDHLGNAEEPHEVQWYKVDSQPPIIEKTVGEPQYGDCPPPQGFDPLGGNCYIRDHVTPVTFDVYDDESFGCAVNDVECEWRYRVDGGSWSSWYTNIEGPFYSVEQPGVGSPFAHAEIYKEYLSEDVKWTFTITDQSDHYGVGLVINSDSDTDPEFQVYFADWSDQEWHYQDYGPDQGGAYCGWETGTDVVCSGGVCTNGISATGSKTGNIFTITIPKSLLGGMGSNFGWASQVRTTLLGVYPDWTPWCGFKWETELVGPGIIFEEDSIHDLQIHCWDALGNEVWDEETFQVDSLPPTTTKDYNGPYKYGSGPEEWISSETEIILTATDEKVGPDKIYWRNTIVDDRYCWTEFSGCQIAEGSGDWDDHEGDTVTFYKTEESCHLIEFYAVDKLGNTETIHKQCVFVDNTPPYSVKEVGEPRIRGDGETFDWWVTKSTPITLDCVDPGLHPVDQETLCFKVSLDDEKLIYITENYCKGDLNDEGYCCVYVGDDGRDNYLEFHFMEDSYHNLEYYCVDHLGNTEEQVHIQWFKVDSTPPETTKIIDPDAYVDPKTGAEYIDTTHEIELTAEDGGEHCAIGVDKIWYMNVIDLTEGACLDPSNCIDVSSTFTSPIDEKGCVNVCQEDGCSGLTSPDWEACVEDCAHNKCGVDPLWKLYDGTPIQKEWESCHMLHYFSVDHLGNVEDMNVNCFFVDKRPPVTRKWYEGPYYNDNDAEWITSETEVHLSAADQFPHPSGVAATYYKDTYLPDEQDWDYCYDDCEEWIPNSHEDEGWLLYEGHFHKEPESCHIIEYYSVDNVGKKEPVQWQCVFVDNTPPTPEKTVGEPKVKWDGQDSYFYPDIGELCWNGEEDEIECWKITMLTPITLDCIDQGDHPVDEEEVCFKVDLDGEDATEGYCDFHDSGHIGDDGFCCVDHTIDEFLFDEETEHNLKYYCVDALGNSNKEDVDEEKFKVEGTKFEIPLFKKWNLISVPFVLLDDDPEVVFKDTDGVASVWAYDGENDAWLVWTPDNGAPDSLTSIDPGWGYWVLEMDDEEWLTIGGSLFSPNTMPPSRNLVKGWNLIGYYGTSWELYDWGDFDFMCGDAFDFPDRFIYGDKVYCSLNSLIDTQEGYPRWSSLWSYINCGDHFAKWLGLNACADQSVQQLLDRMYAGRGYWIELDVPDIYAPATTCIWNDDFECRWTGGGIIP